MEKALKLIVKKSDEAMDQAIKTLSALRMGSPAVATRYTHAAQTALNDSNAQFTPEERELISGYMEIQSDDTDQGRSYTLRVRLNQDEYLQLQNAADGMTMSEYVRQKIFS